LGRWGVLSRRRLVGAARLEKLGKPHRTQFSTILAFGEERLTEVRGGVKSIPDEDFGEDVARPGQWHAGDDSGSIVQWRRSHAGPLFFPLDRGLAMVKGGHLWAIGYDHMERAEEVRAEVARLHERHCLTVLDTAVVVRYPDGTVTLNGEPFLVPVKCCGHGFAKFLAALALGAPPLTGAAVGAWAEGAGQLAAESGIEDRFIREVQGLMKADTSALFVLDREGNLEVLLQGLRGLGGTVLRTNVDVERARLIQTTLDGTVGRVTPGAS
jgi:uncharacterized membrane protein